MVILHIASLKNEFTTGVAVAVPQHVNAQSAKEHVALLNINNIRIDSVEQQFEYQGEFDLESLPFPFSKLDLVVFHNVYYIEFVRIAKKLKKKDIPYVIVPHGTLTTKAQHKKWFKKVVANLVMFNSFFNGASGIQFVSEREMEYSKYKKKGFIGTNGVHIPDVRRSPKYRNEIKMVYIGRTEVQIKGLDLMISAVSHMRKLFNDNKIHLDLYGPDYQGRHLEVLALIKKYDVEDYVSLHNAVIGNQKEKILLDADIFIQTSRTEGMPMGLLEALSYGIPCIVTEGTGMGNQIKEYKAGWVADTSMQGIVKAILESVSEKEQWDEKSKQARNLIVDNYVWEKVVHDVLGEYEKIVRMRIQ